MVSRTDRRRFVAAVHALKRAAGDALRLASGGSDGGK